MRSCSQHEGFIHSSSLPLQLHLQQRLPPKGRNASAMQLRAIRSASSLHSYVYWIVSGLCMVETYVDVACLGLEICKRWRVLGCIGLSVVVLLLACVALWGENVLYCARLCKHKRETTFHLHYFWINGTVEWVLNSLHWFETFNLQMMLVEIHMSPMVIIDSDEEWKHSKCGIDWISCEIETLVYKLVLVIQTLA